MNSLLSATLKSGTYIYEKKHQLYNWCFKCLFQEYLSLQEAHLESYF